MSIVGSNLGSNDYVGAAGGGYRIGIAQANFRMDRRHPGDDSVRFHFLFPTSGGPGFIPYPNISACVYNQAVRAISAVILSFFSLFIVGIYLWATATMLQVYVGIDISVGVWITAIVVGLYTITGGMAAVAISDTVQFRDYDRRRPGSGGAGRETA